jgi:hypothetical protein
LKNWPKNGMVSDKLAFARSVTIAVLKKVERNMLIEVLA